MCGFAQFVSMTCVLDRYHSQHTKYSRSALKYGWHIPCTLCPSTFVRYGVTTYTLFSDGCPVAAQDTDCDKHSSSRTVQQRCHLRVCRIDEGHSVIGKGAVCSGSMRKCHPALPPPPFAALTMSFVPVEGLCVSTGSHGVT
jgi:hypothetical protein